MNGKQLKTSQISLAKCVWGVLGVFTALGISLPAQALFTPASTVIARVQVEAADDQRIMLVDQIVTGKTVGEEAINDWQRRHGKRRRCGFCVGYQPFPGD